MTDRIQLRWPGALPGLLLLAACSPSAPPPTGPAPTPPPAAAVGLPGIPRVEGPLQIRVVHPVGDAPRPRVDSTYVYGTVGTGTASLSINGTPVEVRPNGAFLAFLPLPQDGAWRFEASARGQTDSETVAYRVPAPPATPGPTGAATPRPERTAYSPALPGIVSGGADTLATGSDVAVGRPTPTGTYRWFLPKGARVPVVARQGDLVQVQLGDSTAWFDADDVALPPDGGAVPDAGSPPIAPIAVVPAAGWVDLVVGAGGAPFHLLPERDRLVLTVYGRSAPPGAPTAGADPLLGGIAYTGAGTGSARAEIRLNRPLWGYKAFYSPSGDLVLRLRRPPAIDAASPLRGRRIVIDPGHPPGGATGPTGLTEAEANLAISLRLADQLRARGAEVILTRTDNTAVPLEARPAMAVQRDAELLVSVHNNAFGEGVNPFVNNGTSTYHFHPFSADLARALNQEIVGVTRVRDLGARTSNLALVRPTWMPSTLTESLFMLIPEQEAALRDPAFLDRLAAAHVRGIEAFLRSAAGGS